VTQALYRKYRSKTLAEIVGQSHVTDILARSLTQGRVAHAYLLTGPRGVGKTSIARILAHEINGLPYTDESNHLDIIEIDAASNNGVEDVRDLRDKVQIAPVSAKRKIYIIDEVHMLSKAAFNALLKTLEEPPEHAVFILATTDADKLPATIISRTQRYHFRAISPRDAETHLKHIASEEKIAIDSDAIALVALHGDGSFRDSISLLDQLRGLVGEKETITRELVENALGLASHDLIEQLLAAYDGKKLEPLVQLLNESEDGGVNASVLASQLMRHIRETIVKHPQRLELLDKLTDVAKSSQPYIRLLVALAAASSPKPKHAALLAPTPEVHASIESLVAPKKTAVKSLSKEKPAPKPNPSAPQPNPEPVVPPDPAVEAAFDWTKLVEHTRANYVAIFSVLSKCSYELRGDVLVIYTGNAFYKKKLDDTKYRTSLSKSLVESGCGDLAIETIPTPPPPKDSVAASVAAIMGGGEEVSVE